MCNKILSCRYRRAYTEGSSVSGNLVQDSLWLQPPSSAAESVDGGQTTPHQRTFLSSGRRLQQSAGDGSKGAVKSPSTDGVAAPILFGCVTDERGQIYRQKADGILGLADEDLSVPNQLATAGAIADTFTLCYGAHSGEQTNDLRAVVETLFAYAMCEHMLSVGSGPKCEPSVAVTGADAPQQMITCIVLTQYSSRCDNTQFLH